jgi:hypothetical protein
MGNLGFKYIREAVLIVNDDESWLDGITKPGGLYYSVAKKYGTTSSRVERSIRHAIEQSFLHANLATLNIYFGNTADLDSGKLSNRNFLAALAYVLKDGNASVTSKNPVTSNVTGESCTLCGSESRLIKVDNNHICLVCLHKANLSLTAEH